MIFKKDKIVFAVSPKKKALLDNMKIPEGYTGLKIETIVKELKMDASQTENYVKDFMEKYLARNSVDMSKVAIFKKSESIDGALSKSVINCMTDNGDLSNL
jgi:hypothetical protein